MGGGWKPMRIINAIIAINMMINIVTLLINFIATRLVVAARTPTLGHRGTTRALPPTV